MLGSAPGCFSVPVGGDGAVKKWQVTSFEAPSARSTTGRSAFVIDTLVFGFTTSRRKDVVEVMMTTHKSNFGGSR